MELEKEAVPLYQRALALGLSGEERQGALLGLGSTYRTLGRYEEARQIFEFAIQEYPAHKVFHVFHAMVLYNLNDHAKAMEILLQQLAETSGEASIQAYRRAILYYADKLDQVWG